MIFAENVESEWKKHAKNEQQKSVVNSVIKDLNTYLLNSSEKYSANQEEIGWSHAFREYVTKTWSNEWKDRWFDTQTNKALVKYCALHYVEYWKNETRNVMNCTNSENMFLNGQRS